MADDIMKVEVSKEFVEDLKELRDEFCQMNDERLEIVNKDLANTKYMSKLLYVFIFAAAIDVIIHIINFLW